MDNYKEYIGTVIFFIDKQFNAKQPYLYVDKNTKYYLSYNIEELAEKFDNKKVKVIAMESPDGTQLWASAVKEF